MPRDINILIAHPSNDYNCGDLLTYHGTVALLNYAAELKHNINILQFDFLRALREDNYIPSRPYNADIIVLAGTPWLWDRCEGSSKYNLLFKLKERYPNAKWIGLGIGSCYPKIYAESWMACAEEKLFDRVHGKENNKVRNLFKDFSVLTVRDELADFVFNRWEIPARYTYDTSLFSKLPAGYSFGSSGSVKSALVFYDPTIGLSKGSLSFDPEEYIRAQIQWAVKTGADTYVISIEEYLTAQKLGLNPVFSSDIAFLEKKFHGYGHILSGRVHMAVLALLSGVRDISVLPVDSRYLTLAPLPIKFKFIDDPWKISTLSAQVPLEQLQYTICKEGLLLTKQIRSLYEGV